MKIAELRAGLEKLVPLLADWRAKIAAEDIARLIELMEGYEDLTVAQFCARARKGLESKTAGNGTARTTGRAALPNEKVVAAYVGELNEAKSDRTRFEAVVATMKKDKKVRLTELGEIAARFTDFERRYKNKAEAFEFILQQQISDLRLRNRLPHISDIF